MRLPADSPTVLPTDDVKSSIERFSFRTRLTLLSAMTSALALVFASGALLTREIAESRQAAEADLSSVAELVGANSIGALAFHDAEAARANLAALAQKPHIVEARLFLPTGVVLADYESRPGQGTLPSRVEPGGHRRADGSFTVFSPVLLGDTRLGTVYVRASREGMMARVHRYGTTVLVVLPFACAFAALLGARLLASAARPVLALTAAARRVCDQNDYSVRVTPIGAPELLPLQAAFNQMLSHIENQDAALRAARDKLEERVLDRVAELNQSQAELRAVVEHSTNMFYTCTPDRTLTYLSPQVRIMLDCEPDQAPTRLTDWLTDAPVNTIGRVAMRRTVLMGHRQPPFELQLRSAQGRLVWVSMDEAPVMEDGCCTLIVGALTDVTERKLAETEKRRLEDQLRQAQKMEAIGRLAGGVAHDFNNVLGVIYAYSESLLRKLGPDSPLRHSGEQILKSAEKAAELTRQLLAFSRKQVIDPKVLSLSAVVADTEKMLRRVIGEDIHLVVEAPEAGMIRADAGQIGQVLMNLAVNARDAMPAGGTLRLRLSGQEVHAGDGGPVRPGTYVVLEVADTGTGMDEETLAHLFEPFFTTKESGKGTGLGLATVYGIVEQSQGTITVDSQPGRGTTFRVYLPRVEEPRTLATEIVSPIVSATGEMVLLVEDDDMLRDMIATMLREAGYAVLAAHGGEQALEVAATHRGGIDLVLTDVVMPGLHVREMIRQLRDGYPDVRVLYISGYTDDVLARQGIPEPGMPLLQKPFTAAALSQKAHEALTGPGTSVVASELMAAC